jgi:hypothetical protein
MLRQIGNISTIRSWMEAPALEMSGRIVRSSATDGSYAAASRRSSAHEDVSRERVAGRPHDTAFGPLRVRSGLVFGVDTYTHRRAP